ncbi:Tat pathway signal protein [Psychrosphaera saromensis]|uniref:Tat pathway signal protein n=1 Tax=Psychrosphaera saromensis TaxID=716813 RepID=A0A2S7UST7_9GAMM|nr:DUF1501 domain-containing protein [Psychrosphaera saromensis]PQJ52805.1 hypothetical protein BTO11_03470 [Psychrosphaera saromensis]GHB71399.1 Tat pathway signal protein [Psychrosphaera saromensis]GLQ13305.1 Tat pathway signal protein [Psychrosphaera saromensis]
MSINRRDFLSLCLKGGVSAAALTNLQLQALTGSATAIELGDYKALVCIYLFGGNDSLNMLMPIEGDPRTLYEESRQNLAVASPIKLVTKSSFDGLAGMHPSLSPIQSVFDSANLAFVGGVGTLLAPTTLDDYKSKAVSLPQHLFSHNDQQSSWMYGSEKQTLNTGWGARLLERLEQQDKFAANISLSGTNLWQTGTNSQAFALNKSGISKINALSDYEPRAEHVTNIMNRLLSSASHPLSSAYASSLTSAINNTELMNNALENAPELATEFSETNLSEQLATVAKTISIQSALSSERQVFFVSLGGFDTHDDQLEKHPILLETLAQGLSEFNSAMEELGMSEKVTTFTMSEFGRTLTSNGDGTDHGWAGNQIIMGGAVSGGDIYGEFLSQELNGPLDLGGGRLIPQVANEQYFATLAQWFGVPNSELGDIFPNLQYFDNSTLDFFV